MLRTRSSFFDDRIPPSFRRLSYFSQISKPWIESPSACAPTLEFASLCLRNAVVLLPRPPTNLISAEYSVTERRDAWLRWSESQVSYHIANVFVATWIACYHHSYCCCSSSSTAAVYNDSEPSDFLFLIWCKSTSNEGLRISLSSNLPRLSHWYRHLWLYLRQLRQSPIAKQLSSWSSDVVLTPDTVDYLSI